MRVRRHGATMFVYVGELCRYLLRQPPSPDDRNHRLRLAAGAGLRPDIWEAFQKRFAVRRIVEMYGMTEGNVNLMNLAGRVGSVGRPHPFQHDHVRLARYDVARGELARNEQGFLEACEDGEPGDRYLVIDRGEAEVSRFGEVIARLGPGEGAGEIALINDIPRTASVQAVTTLEGFALGHDDFVEAVSGHAVSQATARDLVDEHLTADAARDA